MTFGGCITKSLNSTHKASFKMSAFERVSDSSSTNSEQVKWQREIINTCPDNFELSRYEDDSGAIVIQSPGIYEVLFTFFVFHDSQKPSIQLKLNGKPVLSTIDAA